MPELTKRSRPLTSKRTQCPKCGSSDGLALYTDSKEEGYCFSCAKRVGGAGVVVPLSKMERSERLSKWHRRSTSEAITYRNGLSTYLITRLGDGVKEHLKLWEVGTDNIGSCVFWHRSSNGELATAKTIPYDALTGKRLRKEKSPISWKQDGEDVHVDSLYGLVYGKREDGSLAIESYKRAKGYELPLYGEHLLEGVGFDVPVLLVESEKTAVVASYLMPDFAVVACGGAKSLTAQKAQALIGRQVFILTDADEAGRDGALKAASVLYEAGAKPVTEVDGLCLADYLLTGAPKGYDLADYCLENAEQLAQELEGAALTEPVVVEKGPAKAEPEVGTLQIGEKEPAPQLAQERTYPELTGGREGLKTAILRAFGTDKVLSAEGLNARIEERNIAGGKDIVYKAVAERLIRLHPPHVYGDFMYYMTGGKEWTR
jgi:hypothetical protein